VSTQPPPPAVPTSTYRVQFSPSFSFRDATALVPYLADLGIGSLYASPYLRPRPGSEHGYDIVDHNALNPELGTAEDHAAMIAAAHARGMGHILDFVPNHMGVGFENPWWRDVLEWGERSPYARFFDIDWEPLELAMRGKVLLPFLGDHYGAVLERGELTLAFDAATGSFELRYFSNRFPLGPKAYGKLLDRALQRLPEGESDDAAVRLRAIADDFDAASDAGKGGGEERRVPLRERLAQRKLGLATLARENAAVAAALEAAVRSYDVAQGDTASVDALDAIVREQAYRLAFWRVAVDEINYRRFFDINDLAGLRQEDAEVLARTHELVFRLIGEGKLQGLRIDHVDGLANPGAYVNLLHERADTLGQPLWVVVEKILARDERLRASWSIAGTTGYEFANLVNGLFVDRAAEESFTRIYRRVTRADAPFAEIVDDAKHRIMRVELASELTVLATNLLRIARSDRRTSDFTYNALRTALGEVIAAFGVYRTYVTSEDPEPPDVRFIEEAVGRARGAQTLTDDAVYRFIADTLTMRITALPNARYDRADVLTFVLRFQQYTSPVMAKSVEDTAFYRYARLFSLNEVGGDPTRFGVNSAAFHAANDERARLRPHTMISTSTHDHKRGEDVRTRIDALTEFPAEWSRALRRWTRMVPETKQPSLVARYMILQTLIGTWDASWADPAAVAASEYDAYVERIAAYALKAIREAKVHTSWGNPNAGYEAATDAFVRTLLARTPENAFLPDFVAFVRMLAPLAAASSLAQVVLKLTSPGIPDIYQGCEFWDLSLVDPDNRRAVDYAARRAALDAVRARVDAGEARACAEELAGAWTDARVKLFTTWRLLQLRAERRATFVDGGYEALAVSGTRMRSLLAFRRDDVVVVVPRLTRRLRPENTPYERLAVAFDDETVTLHAGAPERWRNVFTDEIVSAHDGALRASELFAALPVAVFVPA
jgi:(1->4)-alpha-D-glucan 1-alpha-D-glucosylmutase